MVLNVLNNQCNQVICPYCGYRLPMWYKSNSNCEEILVICKGRSCKKSFNLIVKDGVQKNLVPDDDTISAFEQVFGNDYKKHISDIFGVFV